MPKRSQNQEKDIRPGPPPSWPEVDEEDRGLMILESQLEPGSRYDPTVAATLAEDREATETDKRIDHVIDFIDEELGPRPED